jgi:hypothetical protein
LKVFFAGGASQGRLCYNILRKEGHEVPAVYDATEGLTVPWGAAVFHDETAIPEHARACEGFLVCIGDVHGHIRARYSNQLQALGLKPVSAIHPTAYFGDNVRLGAGLQAMARSVVTDDAGHRRLCHPQYQLLRRSRMPPRHWRAHHGGSGAGGGKNGLADRSDYTRKAKAALARIEGIQLTGAVSDPRPVLRRGSTGDAVGELQIMLQKLKFPLAIDEDFGAATELAVMRFQGDKKLTVDGIVGKETWDSIEKAAKT